MSGSMFTIEPLRKYFPMSFADSLTEDSAISRFHAGLDTWGRLELAYKGPKTRTETLDDGTEVIVPEFPDRDEWESRFFILDSFYNLCCLGTNYKTIEQLVFLANMYRSEMPAKKASRDAFLRLLGVSRSFLLAEWSQDILMRAISNNDEVLFKHLPRWLNENIPVRRFNTVMIWLGTTLLWYLGGKDIYPRKQFLWFLKQKGIVSKRMSSESFKAMLSNLGLTRNLSVSK